MAGCTQGNFGLFVAIIDTYGPPINRENPGRSLHPSPLVVVLGEGVCGHWGPWGSWLERARGLGLNHGDHLVVLGAFLSLAS